MKLQLSILFCLLLSSLVLNGCSGLPPFEGGTTIDGRILSQQTGQPLQGAVVTLQLPDGNPGVYRIVHQTSTDARGYFVFRNIAAVAFPQVVGADGFVLVATRDVNDGVDGISSYAPFGEFVSPGTRLNDIVLPLVSDSRQAVPAFIRFNGNVTTEVIPSDIRMSALQPLPCAQGAMCQDMLVTIPIVPSLLSHDRFTTAQSTTCAPNAACGAYNLDLRMAALQTRGRGLLPNRPLTPVTYYVEARSFSPGTSIGNCSPSTLRSIPNTFNSGSNQVSIDFDFNGCR
jgi:hypothetical protein